MISSLVETLIGIIKFIWNTPTWVGILVIVIFVVLYGIGQLFGVFDIPSDSGNGGCGGNSDNIYTDEPSQIEFDKPKQPFVVYDYNGDRRGRGDCFYDSKGYRRSWGESYYDAHGYFRSWGDCFYDTQGNFVDPNS